MLSYGTSSALSNKEKLYVTSQWNFSFLFFYYYFILIFLSSFKVFTNSDRTHAMRALDRLGIKDCFEQIICFETINPNLPNATRPDEFPVLLKPSLDAFKIALHAANVDPRRTVRAPGTAFTVKSR